MDKRILLGALVLCGAGFLYKRSAQGMKGSSSSLASVNSIILVSKEGEEIPLQRSIAEQSTFFRNLVQNSVRGTIEPISIPFSSLLITTIVEILHELPDELNTDNFIINKFGLKNERSSMALLVNLSKLADFLQLDELSDSLMKLYIFQSLRAKEAITIDEIRNNIVSDLKEQRAWMMGHGKETEEKYEMPQEDKDLYLYKAIDPEKPIKSFAPSLDRLFEYVTSSVGYLARGIVCTDASLHIANPNITNLYALSLLVENKPTIKWITIRNTRIAELQAGVFLEFKNVQHLDLGKNALKKIHEKAFVGLEKLQSVSLLKNQLVSLSAKLFSDSKQLAIINCMYNTIASLPEGLLEGLTKLDCIYFSYNKISSIPKGFFTGLNVLSVITLDHNKLTSLDVALFNGLTSLLSVNLCDNKLEFLPVKIFKGCDRLNELFLADNPVAASMTVDRMRHEYFLGRMVDITL